MTSNTPLSPFAISGALKLTPLKPLNQGLERLLEKVFSLRKLEGLYQQLPPSENYGEFLRHSFELLNINYQVQDEQLANIPKTGPVVLVANHPFGGLDGLILADMLRKVRPDVKIMANGILQRVPELEGLFIPVNPFGGNNAARANVAPMREALRWLKQDGLLVVFPSGEVSNFDLRQRSVIDPPWAPTVARLVRLSHATVQPVYFHGSNSKAFQLAGLIHPVLRTAMLPRELINKAQRNIQLSIGQPIPANKLDSEWSDSALSDYLRWRTYQLRDGVVKSGQPAPILQNQDSYLAPVTAQIAKQLLMDEVMRLDDSCCLLQSGEYQVFIAEAEKIPQLLHEIGRLRELTFRATGEGTGREIDLDLYDNYYLHLFIWNSDKQEVVGAYRLGLADHIVQRFGVKGLYSYSLFKYKSGLIRELNPAIELGRSFVRIEYQRSFSPLLLLWRGIARFVAKNPQYHKLFGPVSISSEYQRSSQQMMVDFLRMNNDLPKLSQQVKPRRAFRPSRYSQFNEEQLKEMGLNDISTLIAEIEPDHKGVPILIKQYLKLGGQILQFSVDQQFSDVLDGLIMVDLLQSEPKVLAKYMGEERLQTFTAYHQQQADRQA